MNKLLIDETTVKLALDALTGNWRTKEEMSAFHDKQMQAIAALKALDPFANVGKGIEQPATTENNGGKTGWPPGLLQDDCKGLSKWLSNQPDAKRRVREALAEESAQQVPSAVLHTDAAGYATNRKNAYIEAIKRKKADHMSEKALNNMWVAHYEGYREGYWVATGDSKFSTNPAKLKVKNT